MKMFEAQAYNPEGKLNTVHKQIDVPLETGEIVYYTGCFHMISLPPERATTVALKQFQRCPGRPKRWPLSF